MDEEADVYDRVKIVTGDLLLSLYSCRLIGKIQFRAGRRWQDLMLRVELQGFTSYDWSKSIFEQCPYQTNGEFSERQQDAFDRRAAATAAIGRDARNALDRMLAEGSYAVGWYDTDGIDELSDLLTTLARHFDFEASGEDDGYSNEVGEPGSLKQQREAFMRRLHHEQPWLFARTIKGFHGRRRRTAR